MKIQVDLSEGVNWHFSREKEGFDINRETVHLMLQYVNFVTSKSPTSMSTFRLYDIMIANKIVDIITEIHKRQGEER